MLSSNGVKNRGGVFDAVVQARYRRVEVYEYQNREGEPVKQAMPGQFKWESTPGRWLLDTSPRLNAEAFNQNDSETLGLLCPVAPETLLWVASLWNDRNVYAEGY